MKHVNTTEMYFQVINCEEIDELKQILNKYSPYYSNWRDYVNNVMLTNGLSYEKLGKKCGFSKNTIKGWVKNNNVPKSRENFIKFGMGIKDITFRKLILFCKDMGSIQDCILSHWKMPFVFI